MGLRRLGNDTGADTPSGSKFPTHQRMLRPPLLLLNVHWAVELSQSVIVNPKLARNFPADRIFSRHLIMGN